MIERRINGNAFYACEDMLLVPVPGFATDFEDGFVGEVAQIFPESTRAISAGGGLALGGLMVYGALEGTPNWQQPYSLTFAAIHLREENGWQFAPALLENVLERLTDEYGTEKTLATAGVPGTGLSGLRGDATPVKILSVLDNCDLAVTIYDRGPAGDREPLEYPEPTLQTGATKE
jgi:hypothetical protein